MPSLLDACISIYLAISIYLSVYLSIDIYLSIYLSIYLYLSTSSHFKLRTVFIFLICGAGGVRDHHHQCPLHYTHM